MPNIEIIIIILHLTRIFKLHKHVLDHFRRLKDTTKETQDRLEKIGKHKLGPVGYVEVKGRYVSVKILKLSLLYFLLGFKCFP